MTNGSFYKHKDSIDICFEILEELPRTTPYTGKRLRVQWWNLGYMGKPWRIRHSKKNSTQEIEIKWPRLGDWLPLTFEQLTTPRNCG